jgi:hypothetical protein
MSFLKEDGWPELRDVSHFSGDLPSDPIDRAGEEVVKLVPVTFLAVKFAAQWGVKLRLVFLFRIL